MIILRVMRCLITVTTMISTRRAIPTRTGGLQVGIPIFLKSKSGKCIRLILCEIHIIVK